MPELPEVETPNRGLAPHIVGKHVLSVGIHQKQLRWEIPSHLPTTIKGEFIEKISRRAKFILIKFSNGTLVMHLGMSGSISVVPSVEVLKKHHHFELVLENKTSMRFHDPRRFGSILWQKNNEQLKLVLKAALDPYTQYYQRKIPEYERKENIPIKSLGWALEGLKTLTSREYTGNAAIEQLQRILSSLTEENAGKILIEDNAKFDKNT